MRRKERLTLKPVQLNVFRIDVGVRRSSLVGRRTDTWPRIRPTLAALGNNKVLTRVQRDGGMIFPSLTYSAVHNWYTVLAPSAPFQHPAFEISAVGPWSQFRD